MKYFQLLAVLVGMVCLVGSRTSAQEPTTSKKLIEWGWDEPDTKFMRQNVEKMEQLAFDGVVFHALSNRGVNLTWEMWGQRKFDLAEFQHAIDDLKATPFRRLTDRFLRVNVTPGNVDWFDDQAWAVVSHNVGVAAQIAKQGGCKGFLFDVELSNNAQPFRYGTQKHRETKTFDQYRAKVRERGQEWMKAVNGPYPDITLLLAYAYSITGGQPKDRVGANYGLVGDFLDGMLEACTPQTTLVDGWEGAYRFKKKEQFDKAYNSIKVKLADWAADPQKYRRHFTAGFGIWMDNDWRRFGWHTDGLVQELLFARGVRGVHSLGVAEDGPVRLDLHRGASLVDEPEVAASLCRGVDEGPRGGEAGQ